MLRLGDLGGNPHVGVFCAASEAIALVAEPVEQRVVDDLREVLGVEVILTTVAGSSVVGSLVAMNSSGIVFSNLAEQHELARIPPSLEVGFMPAKVNAAGNNILVNDHGACAHPKATTGTVEMLEDVLGVEV